VDEETRIVLKALTGGSGKINTKQVRHAERIVRALRKRAKEMGATNVKVLRYRRYTYPEGTAHYDDVMFCGSCQEELAKPYKFPRSPQDVLDECEAGLYTNSFVADRGDLIFFVYCPWCGTALNPEWWRDRTVQNERPVDHYDNPGTHAGDSHIFLGDFGGHQLSSTDPESRCWCEPEITPGIMGCEIVHQDKPFPPERRPVSIGF
jgi:hypothetical protein